MNGVGEAFELDQTDVCKAHIGSSRCVDYSLTEQHLTRASVFCDPGSDVQPPRPRPSGGRDTPSNGSTRPAAIASNRWE